MAIRPRRMKALLRPIAEPLRLLFSATGMTAINAAMGAPCRRCSVMDHSLPDSILHLAETKLRYT